jgi:hypothetical protein
VKIAGVVLLVSAALSGAAHGASDRENFRTPIQPSVGNWYAPLSNVGGITFDVINDTARPVAIGSWSFNEDGATKTLMFQADLVYRSHADAIATGVIADMDSALFSVDGRGDFDSPVYRGGSATNTGRTISLEFNSSRTGRFIYNKGKPDERAVPIVATLRGLPQVAATDYAGDWYATVRYEYPQGTRTFAGNVVLQAYSGNANYVITDRYSMMGRQPAGVRVPDADARRYRMFCPSNSNTGSVMTPCEATLECTGSCEPGTSQHLLWVNANEVGSFAHVTVQTDLTHIYDWGDESAVVYADGDRITIRRRWKTGLAHFPYYYYEINLIRQR